MRPRPPLPTRSDEELARAPENQPRGVAVAVIFDWATATLIVALLLAAMAQYGAGSRQAAAAGFLALVVGVPLVILGEALRRGRRRARIVQIVAAGLIGAIRLAGLLRDLGNLARGDLPLTINLPSLLAALFIIWGLTRPQTIAWFARPRAGHPAARHGGRWLLAAVAGSVLLGVAAMFLSLL